MTLETDSPSKTDPPVFLLKDLTTRTLDKHEHTLAGQLLKQQHYLGDCPAGRQLLQVVEHLRITRSLPNSSWSAASTRSPLIPTP